MIRSGWEITKPVTFELAHSIAMVDTKNVLIS